MGEMVSFFSDDLIYNRFDLIFPNSVVEKTYAMDFYEYRIQFHFENSTCKLNLWGKKLPQQLFDTIISNIFNKYPVVASIEVQWAGNNFQGQLKKETHYAVFLNGKTEPVLNRISSKERYNIRRQKRNLLDCKNGRLVYINDKKEMIPYVTFFFKEKKTTHHKDYGMSEQQYLDSYYVTDMLAFENDEKIIAVLFFNITNKVVYFENFTYDLSESKWSPGYLIYIELLLWCEAHDIRSVYLAGGSYAYKKKFQSIAINGFNGLFFRNEVFEQVNLILEQLGARRAAIYGYGKVGHEFMQLCRFIKTNIIFGIDKNAESEEGLFLYKPDSVLPDVDIVIITLMDKNCSVEHFLKDKNIKFVYWYDVLYQAIDRYLEVCRHGKI